MDQKVEMVFGSDLQRNGVFLELGERREGAWTPFLEVFRSEQDDSVTVTFHTDDGYELPFSVLEEFVHRARRQVADRASPNGSSPRTA